MGGQDGTAASDNRGGSEDLRGGPTIKGDVLHEQTKLTLPN